MKVSSQLHAPTSLLQRYLLERRLCGAQNRFGRSDKERRFNHFPCRELNPGRPAQSVGLQDNLRPKCKSQHYVCTFRKVGSPDNLDV
jgi:hypothetical protein